MGCEIVGRITWASPVAHLWVSGDWERAGSSDCDCCFEDVEESDEYLELEREKERLEKVLKGAVEEIDKLKAEVARQ